MLNVTFDGLDQIGNQIVATCQLHVDLSKPIFDAIAKIDESVVDTNGIKNYRDNQREENQEAATINVTPATIRIVARI